MKRQIATLALLVAVPVFGLLSGYALRAHFESEWTKAIAGRIDAGRAEFAQLLRTRLSEVCGWTDLGSALDGVCTELATFDGLIWISLGTAILGISIYFSIAAAAKLAGRSRALLGAIFGPGLRLVVVLLCIVVLLHTGIAAYALGMVETTFIHRIHAVLIFAIGIGGIAGAFAVLKAGWSLSRKLTLTVIGVRSSEERHPGLHALLAEVCRKIGARIPDNVVVGVEPNFFATAAEVRVAGDNSVCTGETLYVSLPLLRVFTRGEMAAVLGHELGHFKGRDVAYTTKFYPIFSGTRAALQSAQARANQGASALALLPAMAILSFFLEQFTFAERRISREREFSADASGAEASSATDLARALVKVGAIMPLWAELNGHMIHVLNQGRSYTNISSVLFTLFSSREIDASASSYVVPHPSDTHPPTSARISALGVELDAAVAEAKLPVSESCVAQLVPDYEELECRLSDIEHQKLLVLGLATLPERAEAAAPSTGEGADGAHGRAELQTGA